MDLLALIQDRGSIVNGPTGGGRSGSGGSVGSTGGVLTGGGERERVPDVLETQVEAHPVEIVKVAHAVPVE